MRTIRKSKEPSFFHLSNIGFIDGMYELFIKDPSLVSQQWREIFAGLAEPDLDEKLIKIGTPPQVVLAIMKREAVTKLVTAFRTEGEKSAKVNPLLPYFVSNADPTSVVSTTQSSVLSPEFYGLDEEDLDEPFTLASPNMPERATVRDTITFLERVYTGSIGFEIMHCPERDWLLQRLETEAPLAASTRTVQHRILRLLTAAETLERYLQTRYVGQKRFSLEGGETLIPMLDYLINCASGSGVQEIVIAMAHRGRLNVLVNILGKPLQQLFDEFEGKHAESQGVLSGDVKYHKGYCADIKTKESLIHLSLAYNPSHLEIVSAVVEGSARARQERRGDRQRDQVVPLLIHGDASFSGQGVVMETLNMSQTRGHTTGGTIHLIINNQIGFTTSNPSDSRSTRYCTDVAKMIDAPVFHVNGDDPEAALWVTRLALDYRMRFHKDVVIDLICFRKMGHNEIDEPAVTQPRMYTAIAQHPGTRQLYAEKLNRAGIVNSAESEAMIHQYKEVLGSCGSMLLPAESSEAQSPSTDSNQASPSRFSRFSHGKWSDYARTALPVALLKQLGGVLTSLPTNFQLHPRLEKMFSERKRMAEGDAPLDWGMAEMLAYATLLRDGYGVRLSGQDSGRGTFSHRHAVYHSLSDSGEETVHSPLETLANGRRKFVVIDSLLSEVAALAFEYGYASTEPDDLVVWEAQFGDFANGAQVVIDQFISSAEAKWGRLSGLVMLLPHGYEGQGPEHSSARLERYLQLCAQENIQVCVPSTPAQMYHLLRRQMLRQYRKPLIVLTPKSLLRHKSAVSEIGELASGCFQPVIGDNTVCPEKVTRVIIASGKVYYELEQARREAGQSHVAIIRLEQLYPFPEEQLLIELGRFENMMELVLAQEEPENQGSYLFVERHLRRLFPGREILYAGREASAAPACGHMSEHVAEQKMLVDRAIHDR